MSSLKTLAGVPPSREPPLTASFIAQTTDLAATTQSPGIIAPFRINVPTPTHICPPQNDIPGTVDPLAAGIQERMAVGGSDLAVTGYHAVVANLYPGSFKSRQQTAAAYEIMLAYFYCVAVVFHGKPDTCHMVVAADYDTVIAAEDGDGDVIERHIVAQDYLVVLAATGKVKSGNPAPLTATHRNMLQAVIEQHLKPQPEATNQFAFHHFIQLSGEHVSFQFGNEPFLDCHEQAVYIAFLLVFTDIPHKV